MTKFWIVSSGFFLAVSLPMFFLCCSSEQKPDPTGSNMETILQSHRLGAWDLDLSNLHKILDDPDKFLKQMSGELKVLQIPPPPAQDTYIYDILIDEGSRRFWIQRKGGYAGVNEIYGVGILEPDGRIRYAEPKELM